MDKHSEEKLQNLARYPRTRFSIGQRMMMLFQTITTLGGHGLQLVVGQIAERLTRRPKGAKELVVGIIHLIASEDGFQTPLVERLVVGNERQSFYQRLYLSPHLGKNGCLLSIVSRKTMHPTTCIIIIIRFGLDERIEGIGDLAIPHNHHPNRTNACALVVGRLEVYCRKVSHLMDAKVIKKNEKPMENK